MTSVTTRERFIGSLAAPGSRRRDPEPADRCVEIDVGRGLVFRMDMSDPITHGAGHCGLVTIDNPAFNPRFAGAAGFRQRKILVGEDWEQMRGWFREEIDRRLGNRGYRLEDAPNEGDWNREMQELRAKLTARGVNPDEGDTLEKIEKGLREKRYNKPGDDAHNPSLDFRFYMPEVNAGRLGEVYDAFTDACQDISKKLDERDQARRDALKASQRERTAEPLLRDGGHEPRSRE